MTYHLAELNIAQPKYAMDDPRIADFVNNLDLVNAHADAADGFMWRLTTEPTEHVFGSKLVNMSVWRDVHALQAYMALKPHRDIMVRGREWFDRMETPHLVLWWVPEGHRPSVEEAHDRLQSLTQDGPTPQAFGWSRMFTAEDLIGAA